MKIEIEKGLINKSNEIFCGEADGFICIGQKYKRTLVSCEILKDNKGGSTFCIGNEDTNVIINTSDLLDLVEAYKGGDPNMEQK